MRNQTPLAPGGPASDVTVYLVLNDFGPLGRAYCKPTKQRPMRRPSLKTC